MADLSRLDDQQVELRPVIEVKHNLRLLMIGYGFLFFAFLALNLQTYVLASRVKVIREDILSKWEYFRDRDAKLTVELKNLDQDILINRVFLKRATDVLDIVTHKMVVIPVEKLPAAQNGHKP